ncbi:sensory neuron membrane protein 1-like isoform X2 [Harmonia axyridis]|uniref:sensory neuron membrane protein 1-like isoform X2 n=1 Tax=Harmonia axyridis TaxID=115357 RepID=UPI001E279240|nr:sensory neuron membrane protein 1-like isoform X2 [Harmonia axyridis]
MQFWLRIFWISVLIHGLTILWTVFIVPKIILMVWEKQTALRKRNEMRSIYLQIPFPLNFKIYFFNVTNPEEVTKGEKPKVQEVGPYAYDEWVSKVDVVDDNAEDTLAYSPLNKFVYNENKTGKGFSQDDIVTVLHPVIVGAVISASESSPALLPILAKAIKSIFRDPESMYLTDKVRNILFDGMVVNCSVSDFAGKAVCSQLKTQLPGLTEIEKNIFKFSLLGPRNDTLGPRTKVKRGIRNSKELGSLVEFDGKKQLDMYDSKECNKFHGTDGWIFPPGLDTDEGIWTFSGDLCRNVKAKFVEPMPFKGLPTDYYEGDLGDQQNDPDEKCYCPTPKTCLKTGLYDLSKCMGVPIIASLPHFLKADESLLEGVEGVHPNNSAHVISIIFERTLGTPVKAAKRIQFNFQIKPNPKVAVMNNVPEVLHPFLWLEESVELEGALLKKVQMVFILKKANTYIRWLILLACLGGIGFSVYLYYQNKDKGVITPIHMINKIMGNNEDEVKEFNSGASSAKSNVSHKSDKSRYNNPAFINDNGLTNRTKF